MALPRAATAAALIRLPTEQPTARTTRPRPMRRLRGPHPEYRLTPPQARGQQRTEPVDLAAASRCPLCKSLTSITVILERRTPEPYRFDRHSYSAGNTGSDGPVTWRNPGRISLSVSGRTVGM